VALSRWRISHSPSSIGIPINSSNRAAITCTRDRCSAVSVVRSTSDTTWYASPRPLPRSASGNLAIDLSLSSRATKRSSRGRAVTLSAHDAFICPLPRRWPSDDPPAIPGLSRISARSLVVRHIDVVLVEFSQDGATPEHPSPTLASTSEGNATFHDRRGKLLHTGRQVASPADDHPEPTALLAANLAGPVRRGRASGGRTDLRRGRSSSTGLRSSTGCSAAGRPLAAPEVLRVREKVRS
jgi:hypothetical protein